MATPNPATLCLTNNSARRIGQRRDEKTPSLHPDVSPRRSTEETEAAVLAPPVDSSDEDLVVNDEETHSMGAKSEGGQESNMHPASETANERAVSPCENVKRPGGSQKRGSSPIEEDDMSFTSASQPKRSRAYGAKYARKPTQNIHATPIVSEIKQVASNGFPDASRKSRKGCDGFKVPPKTVGKCQGPSSQNGSQAKPPMFNKPAEFHPFRRASQDSQDAAFSVESPTSKAFRPLKSTQKSPKSSKSKPAFRSYGPSSRAIRSSQGDRKPLSLADVNVTPPETQVQDAIATSTNLLGLRDGENNVASSKAIESFENVRKTSSPPENGFSDDQLHPSELPLKLVASLSSQNSNLNSSLDHVSISSGLSTPPDSPSKARCPLCKGLVEKLFLEGIAGGKRMTVRQQAEFCKAHKIKSAHDEWRDRGFPTIDWSTFDRRLKTYHHRIEDLLRGDKASFYRNAFEDTVRSGKNRTLRQVMMQGETMEGLSPGYYGSRGAKMMVDNIISRFSSKLRRLGGSDKLISASGVSGYVQAVLAPELAVMLVMDDMKTDQDSAREILRDSIDIGNLLNEEEDEVVLQTSDAEEDIHQIEIA